MGFLDVQGPISLIEVSSCSLEIGFFGSQSKFPFKKELRVGNCLNLLVGPTRPISSLHPQKGDYFGHGHTQLAGQSHTKTISLQAPFRLDSASAHFLVSTDISAFFTILYIRSRALRCYNDCSCAHHFDFAIHF